MSGSVRIADFNEFPEYVSHSAGGKRVKREAVIGVAKADRAGQARKTGRPTGFVGRTRRGRGGEKGRLDTPLWASPALVNIVLTHATEIVNTPSSTRVTGADKCVRMSFPRI